jgi:hypothetical protein
VDIQSDIFHTIHLGALALVDCFRTATAAYSKGAPFYNAWETRSVFQGGFTAVFSTAASSGELCRRSVIQRGVRTVMIVIPPPKMQLTPSVGQGEEDLHVQTLVTQLAVEAHMHHQFI